MSEHQNPNTTALLRLIRSDMIDSFDEELEMEIDDDRLARLLTEITEHPEPATIDRRVYFRELFRLQGELVKLQDWIARNKLKVIVIFEGRDAAGKGGVIKRITQRLNPRICRVAALPAHPMVFSAIRVVPARGRRNRPVRSKLVQSSGR
jgi:polyphosphate kinase